ANPLTGSIGVVTINLPRAAHTAQGSIEEYFKSIDTLVALARKSLLIKRELIEKFTDAGLYPYARHYLKKIKQARGSYWSNHFNTIGVIGMHEACMNLIGQPIQSAAGAALAHKTLTHIREQLSTFQEQDDTLYNLEATPGEGTTCRLARLDKAQFPTAYFSGKNVPFYTNSSHMPVDFTHDIFDALKHQDDLQTLYTGGTVFHGFIGERIDNPEMVKRLIKKIFCTFKLPYITISPTFSICPEHGYIAGEHHRCPFHGADKTVSEIQPTERSSYEIGNQNTKHNQPSI
ncbi:MAG: anaerobic ribonucleoside-triphosphate reductase, partial [Methylophilaceae bacterium]|nr:anaerobic ribonucleoside-triphosphate reductase [Methylophilaceae bacterium]